MGLSCSPLLHALAGCERCIRYDVQELRINPQKREIDDFTTEDLELVGYQHHGTIAMPMAV